MSTRVADLGTQSHGPATEGLGDDRSLVLAFQAGDLDAYAEIFTRYRAVAAQTCYRILQDRDDADEAVQETMLRVFRGLGSFNGRYQLQAWVSRIATNVALDMIRARARRPQRDATLHDLSEERGAPIVADEVDTAEAIERILDQEEVRSTLRSIPDHHREALVLREFEGRSHQEIGEALGVSPKQAKALIHRAKKSFRRAWDEQAERRGIAAIVPILLTPFRLPGFVRRLLQPAHDAVANAAATAQQAAAQVAAAPAAAQGAVGMADKVTAAALTVLVAGTVGVGAVAIRDRSSAHQPAAVSASPAAASPAQISPVPPPADAKPSDARRARPAVKKGSKDGNGQAPGPGEASPSASPSGEPSSSPSGDPSGTPAPPVAPPPAPAWSGSFDTSVGVRSGAITQVAQQITGQSSDRTFVRETMQGPVVGPKGKVLGSVYVDLGGSVTDTAGSLSSLWLWITAPEGQYRYTAGATLTSVERAADGSTTYVFSGDYSLSSVPATLHTAVPHDGAITITLRFWSDGTLFATGVSMTES